jgi:glutamate-1-semialdehyde 2,1-aminomutase
MGTEEFSDRLDAIIEEESASFLERQPRSTELLEIAKKHLVSGLTSSWQGSDPQPIWIKEGRGSHLIDEDGLEFVDMHGGYGAGVAGHGHPAIVAAVQDRVTRGTHFASPVVDAIDVSTELAKRFGLPLWRFGQSGTEATMDVVHLMRAVTGRPYFIKVEGSYHGHHDSVQVSVYCEDLELMGPADLPNSTHEEGGIPDTVLEQCKVVPFNNVEAVKKRLEQFPGQIAGMIVEPIMMNVGIVFPDDDYLAKLKDLLHSHGALLGFDEVKTGFTTRPGGVTEYYGVQPDIVAVAKAMGGGLVVSGIGGTEEVMMKIDEGVYEQCGTFNGNPLAMAAAKACLTEVLTTERYAHVEALRSNMVGQLTSVIEEYELPAYAESIGFKGCVVFKEDKIRNYRDFLEWDDRFSTAHWLYQHKGGVMLPNGGKVEQWMFSVQHTQDDAQRFVDNFAAFAKALRS